MKKKVKVLLFVDRMRHGGIQQFIVENVKHMDKSKVQIDVLTLDDGETYPLEKAIKDLGCNFYKLKGIWINKPTDYLKYATAIDKFFTEHNDYKVIHMNASSKNFILLKYAKKHHIKVRIAHSHNIDFQTKNPIKKIIGNILKVPMKKYATDYFACSYLAGEWLFGKKNIENNKVKVIHNAVDYEKFKYKEDVREKIRKEFNIKNNEILIGHVGRFTNQKNHTFLIDIFYEMTKQNKNVKLILVGIGEKEQEIKNKVKYLKIENKVIFAGFRTNVNEIMQAMDVFLLPSLYEGLPVVGVEAQAAGLPSFTSKDVVTSEVKITNALEFISLDKSPKYWATTILNSDLSRKDTKQELQDAGYFIEDTAKYLVDFYLK